MAKSKLVKANQKIAMGVTSGFHKISDSVVSGYSKIEHKFVDQYLTKDDETIEEAKERLKKEQNSRKETQLEHKEHHNIKLDERCTLQAERKEEIKGKHQGENE